MWAGAPIYKAGTPAPSSLDISPQGGGGATPVRHLVN